MSTQTQNSSAGAKRESDSVSAVARMTWAHAFRDIIVTALNNGQIVVLSTMLFIWTILSKLDSSDLKIFFSEFKQLLLSSSMLGYLLFILSLLFFGVFIRFLTYSHNKIVLEKQNLIDSLVNK